MKLKKYHPPSNSNGSRLTRQISLKQNKGLFPLRKKLDTTELSSREKLVSVQRNAFCAPRVEARALMVLGVCWRLFHVPTSLFE